MGWIRGRRPRHSLD
uniref:Killer cell lectin like receptor K1 n=1 Tax=Callithrix jacchus TaxID=9483 RepID=A4GHD2_CALJA|nr:NKG2D isoform 2 [Callithrix jacchus]